MERTRATSVATDTRRRGDSVKPLNLEDMALASHRRVEQKAAKEKRKSERGSKRKGSAPVSPVASPRLTSKHIVSPRRDSRTPPLSPRPVASPPSSSLVSLVGSNDNKKDFTDIIYCQTMSASLIHQFSHQHPDSLLVTEHIAPIIGYGKNLYSVKGAAHDESECRLCADKHYVADPFINQKELEGERMAVSMLTIPGRGVVRDALTWLAVHREWLRIPLLMHYFNMKYPVLGSAMMAINALPPRQLDRRYTNTISEGVSHTEPPIYCNWLYMPDPERSRVFYLVTRYPRPERIHAYLNVVLGIPKELTRMIVQSTIGDSTLQQQLLTQRLREHAEASESEEKSVGKDGVDHEDVRRRRAERLEKRQDLRALFEVETPRILLISEDGSITALQRRSDYVLRQHSRYINVFSIALLTGAPAHVEDVYESSSDDDDRDDDSSNTS